MVQRLICTVSSARGTSSSPGQGTKIPHALQRDRKKKKKDQRKNHFTFTFPLPPPSALARDAAGLDEGDLDHGR